MMWAIVGILKIIGWTLVILLALILLLLLAILFVSICYQAEGTFLEGKPGGWVKFCSEMRSVSSSFSPGSR